MYSDGVWPDSGDFLKFFSVWLDKHPSPATLLLIKSRVAEHGAVKCAELQESAIVKVLEVVGQCGDILLVLAVGMAFGRIAIPMKHSRAELAFCQPVRNERPHWLHMLVRNMH